MYRDQEVGEEGGKGSERGSDFVPLLVGHLDPAGEHLSQHIVYLVQKGWTPLLMRSCLIVTLILQEILAPV